MNLNLSKFRVKSLTYFKSFFKKIGSGLIFFIFKQTADSIRGETSGEFAVEKEKSSNGILPRCSLIIAKSSRYLSGLCAKKYFIVILLAIIVLTGGLLFYFLKSPAKTDLKTKTGDLEKEINVFKEGRVVGTSGLNQTANLGNLKITVHNIEEGMVETLDIDAAGERIKQKYYIASIEVFNFSNTEKETLHIQLGDDQGNQYRQNRSIGFSLTNVRQFDWDKNVYPRTIREGYLVFPGIAEEAVKAQLVFFIESTKEKVVFELPRRR